MSATVACPRCRARLTVTDDLADDGEVECPKCGTLFPVDPPPALPARRARRTAADEEAGGSAVRASGWASVGGCLVMFLVCGGACFGWNQYRQKALDDLAAGDKLYADGKKGEAVAKYKDWWSFVPDERKAQVIQRVADHEAAGDKAEARRWVEKGLDGRLTVAYETPAARDLLAQVQRERAEAEARRVAEREAHEKARQEAEAKRKAEREVREKAEREAEEKRQRYGSSTDAHRMAETFVKRQLTFPAEAKFGLFSFLTSQNPDKSWKVSGDVTTKNGFGVKVKYRFQVVILRGEDGVWQEVEPVALVELTD